MTVVFLAKYLILVFPLFLLYLLYRKEYKVVLTTGVGVLAAKLVEVVVESVAYIPRPFVLNPELPYYTEIVAGRFSRVLAENQIIADSSFFSNHAAVTFAVSTVIFLTYSARIGMVLYFFAGLVAFGRVLANVHYPIDVIGGAAFGIIVGLTVSNLCVKLLTIK